MKYLSKVSLVLGIGISLFLLGCQQNQNAEAQGIISANGASKDDITNANAEVKLDKIKLPENFKIEVWAADIPNARSLAISEDGVVFVGNRQENKVFAVIDEDGDGKANTKYTLADGLNMPNGVAYKDGDLYVAEVNRIIRFKDIKNNLDNPSYEVVYDGYPTESHHGWKFISFGPDGKLYIPVGAPCNICESENEVFASITRIDVDSPNPTPEIVAHGVRNTVGFDWDPKTGDMWFTDNGRDMMGDDVPNCELNHVTKAGQHFGYPYWHEGSVKDPEFGDKGGPASDYVAPAAKLGAHTAPLGMRFYKGNMFPGAYQNQVFIAKHGSWNRSKKSGYVLTSIKVEGSNASGEKEFASGWLDEASQKAWGRPVDVQEMQDGSLLISDDMAGVIYRVTYSAK
ncbi:glucose/arabinose dehydrogenase [Algoriphagus ratkowskyi]|uniref:Glucose/arabinose dehydrogenase n=1 Tax=Algoriphagus ratkowskyi TaxID=57028 RepID=A0A2W7S1K9_9BACT|nr:PQQ-dependent sugar dehydrogenase [Algoriphagus ratkowskyi]PZX61247.1 glucose/arabinose dehydrogenase [Algoriphagus ratkowskyi]TXD79362.1 sorbosone dehydrogenase family protein [Algoriphagus ratkowskyi]